MVLQMLYEEAIGASDSESEVSNSDDTDYVPVGQVGVVDAPVSPAVLDDSTDENQSNRLSKKGFTGVNPPTKARTRSHNILRSCPRACAGVNSCVNKSCLGAVHY
jgi:hypothetical protein